MILIDSIFRILMVIIECELHSPMTRRLLESLFSTELIGNIAKFVKSSLLISLVRRFLIWIGQLKLLGSCNE